MNWPVRSAGTGRLVIVSLRTADNLVPCLTSRPAADDPGRSDTQAGGSVVCAGERKSLAVASYEFAVLECLQCSSSDAGQPTFYIYVLQPMKTVCEGSAV